LVTNRVAASAINPCGFGGKPRGGRKSEREQRRSSRRPAQGQRLDGAGARPIGKGRAEPMPQGG